jgi:ABC-2 type transport system ATP-binding protein
MIEVSHLVKRYGAHLAVSDLSFSVNQGDVVGFLGPNGAGKSTTLRILAGFLGKTSGTVRVAGHDVETESLEARRAIGYMPEAVPLYTEMRVAEYLAFRAELKGVSRGERPKAIDLAMEKAHVTDVANRVIGALSKGYRQRVGLADALVAKPPLLILDEPTAGLDPNQIREVRDVIRGLGKDHTVLLSTHILSEVEASCDKVIVIAKGKLVAEGTQDEITKKRRSPGIEVRVRGERDRVREVADSVALGEGSAIDAVASDDVVVVRVTWPRSHDDGTTAAATEALVGAFCGAGFGVRAVSPVGSSLEDVFSELTTRAADDEVPS